MINILYWGFRISRYWTPNLLLGVNPSPRINLGHVINILYWGFRTSRYWTPNLLLGVKYKLTLHYAVIGSVTLAVRTSYLLLFSSPLLLWRNWNEIIWNLNLGKTQTTTLAPMFSIPGTHFKTRLIFTFFERERERQSPLDSTKGKFYLRTHIDTSINLRKQLTLFYNVLGTAETPYWWRVTTQIWVVLLIGWSKFPS